MRTDTGVRGARVNMNTNKLEVGFAMILLKEREFIRTLAELKQSLIDIPKPNLFM
jgi:hypothetical protein